MATAVRATLCAAQHHHRMAALWHALWLVLALVLAGANAQPQEICIGVVLPVTGPRNVESLRILDAAKLAADDINADPSHPAHVPGATIRLIADTTAIDSAGYVQFGARRMYDQIVNMRCANGTAPIAIMGELAEDVCAQMAAVATLLQVPVISPGARDPALSINRDANAYTVVFRSSLRDEAEAFKLMFKRYGWTSFVLWHSNSDYGNSLTDSFAGSGLEMVDMPVPATDQGTEVQRALTRILTLRFRIIIVHAEPDLARLMMNLSYRAGMLNGDYIFFGSMTWTSGSDTTAAVFNEEEKLYLQGVIGLAIPRASDKSATFQNRLWARQPLLYPPYFPEQPMQTRVIGYDTIAAVGRVVRNLTAQGLPWTGKWLRDGLIGPTNSGWSGIAGNPVKMIPETGSRMSRYAIMNFQSGAFQQVGIWTPGLLDFSAASATAPIIWPGNNAEASPQLDVPRRTLRVNFGLTEIAVALACVFGLGSALLHYLIYLNTDHEVIKASSPIFCHIILAGGDVAYLMCGLSALSAEQTCSLVPSLISVCFSLVFGALVAKTYRIHRIFNSQELRIKTPTNKHLFAICGALLAYDVLVIALWVGTDAPHAAYVPTPNDPTTAYQGCVMNNATSWSMALFIPKAAVVVFGAWLAYKVRDLNHNFNEARYISLALYNVLLLSTILYGLVSAFPYAVDVVYGLKTIGSATVAFITMLILFAPKFWDVYITKDWIDYHSNSSYVSGVLVHKSSKGSYAKHVQATQEGAAVSIGVGADGKPLPSVGGLTDGVAGGTNGSPAQQSRWAPGGRTSPGSTATGKSAGGGSGGHHHHAHGKKSGGEVYISSPNKGAAKGNAVPAAGRTAVPSAAAKKPAVAFSPATRTASPATRASPAAHSRPVAVVRNGTSSTALSGTSSTHSTSANTAQNSGVGESGVVTVTIETPAVAAGPTGPANPKRISGGAAGVGLPITIPDEKAAPPAVTAEVQMMPLHTAGHSAVVLPGTVAASYSYVGGSTSAAGSAAPNNTPQQSSLVRQGSNAALQNSGRRSPPRAAQATASSGTTPMLGYRQVGGPDRTTASTDVASPLLALNTQQPLQQSQLQPANGSTAFPIALNVNASPAAGPSASPVPPPPINVTSPITPGGRSPIAVNAPISTTHRRESQQLQATGAGGPLPGASGSSNAAALTPSPDHTAAAAAATVLPLAGALHARAPSASFGTYTALALDVNGTPSLATVLAQSYEHALDT